MSKSAKLKQPDLKAQLNQVEQLIQKKQSTDALKQLQKINQEYPNEPKVLEAMIKTYDQMEKIWNEDDFQSYLSLTMQKELLENPELKRSYARFEPDWKKTAQLIQKLLSAPEKKEDELIQKIATNPEKAIYPLIDALLWAKQKLKDQELQLKDDFLNPEISQNEEIKDPFDTEK